MSQPRRAGLRRHIFARLVAEEAGSLLETREALGHENQSPTGVYVQRITVRAERHGRRVADRMKLDRAEGIKD